MRELIALYQARLLSTGDRVPVNIYQDNMRGCHNTERADLNHVLWMLDEMERMLTGMTDGTVERQLAELEKFNRWLGFVQGVLWQRGFYNLDQLRDQTRKALNG